MIAALYKRIPQATERRGRGGGRGQRLQRGGLGRLGGRGRARARVVVRLLGRRLAVAAAPGRRRRAGRRRAGAAAASGTLFSPYAQR